MATQVVGCSVGIEVTPSIGLSAYAAEAQFGGIQYLTGAAYQKFSLTTLVSVIMTDKNKNTAPMTLFFFDSFPTINSVDGGIFNLPDEELRTKCIGHVAFTSADYATVSGASVLTGKLGGVALTMRSKAEAGTLYVVPKLNAAATWTAGSSPVLFRYLFNRDA